MKNRSLATTKQIYLNYRLQHPALFNDSALGFPSNLNANCLFHGTRPLIAETRLKDGRLNVLTHDELIKKMMKDPAVHTEYDRIEREEMPMLGTILKACFEAGPTQAQVAERMGTKAPAVARLENALVTGKHSHSIMTW